MWFCWYVRAENSPRKEEPHVKTFFPSTEKVNTSVAQTCWSNTAKLHFKVVMRQEQHDLAV